MKNRINLISIGMAVLFAAMFYHESIGLNWLIFEVILLSVSILSFKPNFTKPKTLLFLSTTFITLILYVIYGSINSLIMNWISLFILNGLFVFEGYKSSYYSALNGLQNLFSGWVRFFKNINGFGFKNSIGKIVLRYVKIIIIPLFIIYFFIVIYSSASPFFKEYSSGFINLIERGMDKFWSNLNMTFVFLTWLGLILSSWFLHHKKNESLITSESGQTDLLIRKKVNKPSYFKFLALKNELRSGLFLLATLNLLIFFMNALEIQNVWFGFEWNGGTLKGFIHEGTYLLIIALLLSMVLVLYYFRGNQNFYTKNKWLKYLTYVWMAQNSIMIISVAVRNFIYIEHFALAYKRIGVFLFLIAAVIGIITILYKVYHKKSSFYLLRTNTLSIYLILVLSCFINWDIIIAKYNFNNFKNSYVHLEYLVDLSDKTIPYIDKDMDELSEIEIHQKQNFGIRSSSSFSLKNDDISSTTYGELLFKKKEHFYKNWKENSWLSWNYADYKAFEYVRKEFE